MKINFKKYLAALVLSALAFNMTGCGPTKILMDTYTPPYKQKQVKKQKINIQEVNKIVYRTNRVCNGKTKCG